MVRRIDWIVSEPAELAAFVGSEAGLMVTPTRSFEIAGPASLVRTYVMCSRTATGRESVGALNRMMANHTDRPWDRP